jgi:hypothetical protein
MTSQTVEVEIDQLLFGYRDGHELLAASIEVNPRRQAELLPHADARFEDKSDHYLVGLPIQDLDAFMLTRIWPAPESPRPGAVWAHSFLIDLASLGAVDPLVLVDHFRRPSSEDWDWYRKPLAIKSRDVGRRAKVADSLMFALCDVAYGENGRQAVVIWPEEQPAETALLALWRRLPASFRSGYSFRTRGRARTGESPYAIQVATQLAGRSASQKMRVVWPEKLESPKLSTVVLADASRDPKHPLGAAIEHHASQPADAILLADVWPGITAEDPLTVLDDLTTGRPAETASELAGALFGPLKGDWQLWKLPEGDRVVALLEASSSAELELLTPSRMSAAWDSQRKSTLLLLDGRRHLDSLAAQFLLTSAVKELSIDELLTRVEDDELMYAASAEREDLLRETDFWIRLERSSNSELRKWALIQAGPKVAGDLILGKCWGLLEEASNDPVVFESMVDSVARAYPKDLARWRALMDRHTAQLVRLLRRKGGVSPEAIVLAAASLPQSALERVPVASWLKAGPLIHERSDEVAFSAAARLIAATWRQGNEEGRQLLIECYGPTHRALELNELSSGVARELQAALPERKAKSLAKRLNRVIVSSMESADWTESELSRALAPAGPEARRLVKLVSKKHPLRRRLEGVLKDLEGILPLS